MGNVAQTDEVMRINGGQGHQRFGSFGHDVGCPDMMPFEATPSVL